MTVNVIFKIAAVGILISVLNQILKHSGRDGFSDESCRTDSCIDVDYSVYL